MSTSKLTKNPQCGSEKLLDLNQVVGPSYVDDNGLEVAIVGKVLGIASANI